ncbi:hypothetical protein GCM10027262_30270 [Nocardia tengchongensis]
MIGSRPELCGVGINKSHRPDCKKPADDIQNYVTSSEWKADFLGAFPDLATRDRWKDFQPKPENVNSWSCRDKSPQLTGIDQSLCPPPELGPSCRTPTPPPSTTASTPSAQPARAPTPTSSPACKRAGQ